jgi:cell division protein FtsB
MAKEKKKNQLNSRSVIVIVLCFVLLLYMGIRFVTKQSEINAKQAYIAERESVLESLVAENEEVSAAIKDGDKDELAEEYARKKGYVMPDERVYVDITPGSAE